MPPVLRTRLIKYRPRSAVKGVSGCQERSLTEPEPAPGGDPAAPSATFTPQAGQNDAPAGTTLTQEGHHEEAATGVTVDPPGAPEHRGDAGYPPHCPWARYLG
jgi:hypothetical protein